MLLYVKGSQEDVSMTNAFFVGCSGFPLIIFPPSFFPGKSMDAEKKLKLQVLTSTRIGVTCPRMML